VGAFEKLKDNPCVEKCTEKSIAFTYEFKKEALKQYNQGVSSKEIFRRAGFDLSLWRHDYPKDCLKRWRKIVKKGGFHGLAESSGTTSGGRPKSKCLTDQDRIKRLELQIKYLKAENDFLAKLRAKRAESNSGQNRNTKS
jgi:transposase-like protein